MLRVGLGKHHHLGICRVPPQLLEGLHQIVNFIIGQGHAERLVSLVERSSTFGKHWQGDEGTRGGLLKHKVKLPAGDHLFHHAVVNEGQDGVIQASLIDLAQGNAGVAWLIRVASSCLALLLAPWLMGARTAWFIQCQAVGNAPFDSHDASQAAKMDYVGCLGTPGGDGAAPRYDKKEFLAACCFQQRFLLVTAITAVITQQALELVEIGFVQRSRTGARIKIDEMNELTADRPNGAA